MRSTLKLASIVLLGIVLLLAGNWWEFSYSKNEGEFIKLGGLTFHTSLSSGINESKERNLPMFLYFRSETCYWCIVFENESLSDERIIEILNKNFVLISMDPLKQKKAAANLNVWSSPYIIFFDSNGGEILRIPGYVREEDFMAKLGEVIGKMKIS